jgi:hypothetical protein
MHMPPRGEVVQQRHPDGSTTLTIGGRGEQRLTPPPDQEMSFYDNAGGEGQGGDEGEAQGEEKQSEV